MILSQHPVLGRRAATTVFLAFAAAYFLSALIRAITATLAPTLTQAFALQARDLGLLAGGYFLGFSLMQLPLGTWLDRHGPKRVILCFLAVAVVGCLAFSFATSFFALFAARVLCGVGVSACLMAPLTGYRRWFAPTAQMRANSWMLMTGALGMVASTLPVQWLMPLTGWRPLFWGLALLVLLAMAGIAWAVPRWETMVQEAGPATPTQPLVPAGYAAIRAHPYFRKMVPLGFFSYGGLVAMQTLWAAPWMVKVAGYSPLQAATGLFWINVAMLCTFWVWGLVSPWLARRSISADRLMAWGLPFSFLFLAIILIAGSAYSAWAGLLWALYCMGCTFVSLSQPAIAMAFPSALAGRALSAYNLVIFVGVFVIQWGIGLLIDGFKALGLTEVLSFQLAFGIYLGCGVVSYAYFLASKSHNQRS
ncbi:MAG: hypothetical protein RIS34_1052 [Pseudomonadota bacterium]|jgi:predicted MFS family arabinose efflux permease